MIICAEDSRLILKCQYCDKTVEVSNNLKHRTFIKNVNAFLISHEKQCQIKFRTIKRTALAEKTTLDIIKRLQAVE